MRTVPVREKTRMNGVLTNAVEHLALGERGHVVGEVEPVCRAGSSGPPSWHLVGGLQRRHDDDDQRQQRDQAGDDQRDVFQVRRRPAALRRALTAVSGRGVA